jgi:hypothetical protein
MSYEKQMQVSPKKSLRQNLPKEENETGTFYQLTQYRFVGQYFYIDVEEILHLREGSE